MVVTSMEAVENGSFGGEVLYGTLQNGTLSAGRLCDLVPADVQEKYLGYIDEMIKDQACSRNSLILATPT